MIKDNAEKFKKRFGKDADKVAKAVLNLLRDTKQHKRGGAAGAE